MKVKMKLMKFRLRTIKFPVITKMATINSICKIIVLTYLYSVGDSIVFKQGAHTRHKRLISPDYAYYPDFRWQVSIHCKGCNTTAASKSYDSGYNFLCGGVLAEWTKVYTSGDCIGNFVATELAILPNYLGLPWITNTSNQKYFDVKSYKRDPRYKEGKIMFNQAVLVTSESMLPYAREHRHTYEPVAFFLPSWEIYREVYVVGFGATSEGLDRFPTPLQWFRAAQQSYTDCANMFPDDVEYGSNAVLCAQSYMSEEPRSTCLGDDGGGVVIYNPAKMRYEVIGIIVTLGQCRAERPFRFHSRILSLVEDNPTWRC